MPVVIAVSAVGLNASRHGDAAPAASAGKAAPAASVGVVKAAPSYEAPYDRYQRVVSAMAARRAAALRAGDEAAWLADLEPTATKLLAHERMRFRNLRQLRPTTFTLKAIADVDYKAPTDAPVDGIAPVEQVMRLPQDVQWSKNSYRWKVRIDGERVTVTAIDPGVSPLTGEPDDEGANKNPPWDEVPLRSARSAGVTVLSATNSKWNPRTYLPGAQRAARLVKSMWGKRQAAPGFVVFLADAHQFGRWFGASGPQPNIVGVVALPDMVAADGALKVIRPNKPGHPANEPAWLERNAGARIVLQMNRITTTAEAEHVMAHEMAHAIGPHLIQNHNLDYDEDSDGGLNQPTWAIEGFARWVEHLSEPGSAAQGMRYVRANRARFGSQILPGNKNFYAKDAARMDFNYELASSLFLAAAKVGGRQKAIDLYIALSNQMATVSSDAMFINVSISSVGLDPSKVWAQQNRLAG